MCGIAGYSLSVSTQEVDTGALTRSLLLGIEHRGRDATGIAWHDRNDREVWIRKSPHRAATFTRWIDDIDAHARALIGHTRLGTKGSERDNVNNHPIEHHGIVGTHNGIVYNDDELFAMLGCDRYGRVDSEAIFALIARSGEPPEDVLGLVEGSAAVAWLDVNDEPGTLHLARIASSPLVVAQTKRGSLIYASERRTILEAATEGGFRIKYMNELPEGAYLRVRHGVITDVRRFEKPTRIAPARKYIRNVVPARRGDRTYNYLTNPLGIGG